MTNSVNGLQYSLINSHSPRSRIVDLPVGDPPHEVLVLLQSLRGELPHQQVPVITMLGWVHRDDLVAERELGAALLNQSAHVLLTLEGDGETGERPRHRVA